MGFRKTMQTKNIAFFSRRLLGYIIGFMLFYAPFDGFARLIDQVIPPTQLYSIHEPCFRIPLQYLLDGRIEEAGPVSLVALVLLAVVSLVFGPLFCGKLCPAGALTEFLSRLVPSRFQINWPKHIRVTPLRYGFFAGFLLAPFIGITAHCSYCNFFVFDMLITTAYTQHLPVYSVSLIATFGLWFVLLGLFTRGGRGFCNFLCPVGAFSSLMHAVGRYLPWFWRMDVHSQACIGCGKCAAACPMTALSIRDSKAVLSQHRCIICQACSHVCPAGAIAYRKGGKDE